MILSEFIFFNIKKKIRKEKKKLLKAMCKEMYTNNCFVTEELSAKP